MAKRKQTTNTAMADLLRRLESIEKTMRSMGALVENHDRKMARIDALATKFDQAKADLMGMVDDIDCLMKWRSEMADWRSKMDAEKAQYEMYKQLKQKFGN